MQKLIHALCLVALGLVARAQDPVAITTRTVTYQDGNTKLEGFFAAPAGPATKALPGVLIVHDWTGVQDYAKMRAEMLAKLGYAAFCCDIYGQGVRPTAPKDCSAEAGKYKGDRKLYRQRLALGLAEFRNQGGVDVHNIAAIGYCFGGTGVLELARSGAEVKGVASFHGGLDSPTPEDGRSVKTKVLLLHGADDPFVPEKDVKACLDEFTKAGVDWQMISYSGAVHSFTNPKAGNDPTKGSAYNANADRRSWAALLEFLKEVCKP